MFSFDLMFQDFRSVNDGYAEVRLFSRFDSESESTSYLVMYSGIKHRYFHRSKYFDSYCDALDLYHHYHELMYK